jgi:hypothetical protein
LTGPGAMAAAFSRPILGTPRRIQTARAGLYSRRRPQRHWDRDERLASGSRVCGAVASWGQMQVHDPGVRAEQASVVTLGLSRKPPVITVRHSQTQSALSPSQESRTARRGHLQVPNLTTSRSAPPANRVPRRRPSPSRCQSAKGPASRSCSSASVQGAAVGGCGTGMAAWGDSGHPDRDLVARAADDAPALQRQARASPSRPPRTP